MSLIEEVTIREANPQDSLDLAKLWWGLAKEMEKFHPSNELQEKEKVIPNTSSSYTQLLFREQYKAFIAEYNGDAIGYIDLEHRNSDVMTLTSNILVRQLYVKPDYRNEGLGSKLLDRLIEYANETNQDYITVPVEWDNTDAQRLYKSKDFEEKQIRLVKTLD